MTKRIISMVLAVITALSILPTNIWAGNNTGIAATVRTATATVSDHAAMQGRTVRRNTYWESVELSADPASAGSEFVQASVIPVELYMIVDAVYTRTSDGTVWYKVSAAPGHALPETLSSHRWIMQNFAGNPHGDPDALIAVYELCPDCGKENCKEDHTTQPTETTVPGETTQPTAPSAPVCDICGKESCTAQHVKCGFCGKYDCTEEHIVTVNGTFTDAAGKTQTLTVSAETFPEGTKVTAKQADVNAQLQSFGIPAAKKVFGLDISLQTANGADYQPEAALVKVPVSAPAGTLIGILHTHDGKTTLIGLSQVQKDGTVEFLTDGFSEFAGFTVDFHYNNVDFSIDGMTSIKLSELFTAMGINEDASKATSVVFSDPSLVQVTKQENDWLLTSLKEFSTEETLIVSFVDGHTIIIDVTDVHTSTLDFSPYNIQGYFSSNPKGSRQPYVYLYWGDSDTSFVNDRASDVITFGWVGLSSSEYWFELKRYYWIGDGDPYTPDSGTPGISTIAMGALHLFDTPEVHVKVWDRTITDTSNSAYASIEQATEFVYIGDTIRRNVKIYLDGAEKQTVSNILFPHRGVGTDTPNAIMASDLTTVNPNNSSYFRRGDVGGAATVVASGDTYHVYLVTRGTIQYNANGGSGAPGAQYKYYGINTNLSGTQPSKPYSTFKGWATSKARADAGTVDYAAGATYTGNLASGSTTTLYAVWDYSGANYTVKHFKQNLAGTGYDEVTADRQTIGSKAYATVTPAVKSYTGFTSPATQTVTVSGDGSTVVSYYYTRNTYTVTATAGTGIASVSGGGSYKYGASVTLKANLKTGYAWANWTGTATVATRDYTFTMPANNVSYQANATKENYSISYTLNGGSVATANVASYNVDTPGFTLTNPTKTAYDFVGWTGTGLTGATMTVTVPQGSIGNRSYTANWNPKNYTATFDANGGNVSTGSKSFNVEEALTLPDATKPGYSLVWEVTSGSGNWTVGDTYTGSVPAGKYGDVTFTAQWSPINYSISYNLNGGSVATPNKTSYNVETATFTLTNPTKAGYTFAGWTGTDLTGATVTVTVPQGSIGNRSYTATWTANTYTLTLDYNGGWEFSNANQTSVTKQVTYGTGNNASVSSLQPTRTGYRFVGWFTDPQGGSAVYDSQGNAVPGAYWDANGNWIGTDDMPLYAHWAEQYRYELTFDSNTDDAVTDMPAGMADTGWVDTADKTHTWAVVPVRMGYEFLGWSDDPNATTGAKVTSYTLTGVGAETVSQTLYAVWKAIDYNVTFVDHDGTVLKATVQYPFGTPAESIVRPADPVRAATAQYTYTFSGWDPTVSKVTGDVIYTATYKATLNRYTVTFEDGEGNVLKQETYDYGTKPEYIVTPADPEKEGDQQYTYIFTGWSPAIGQVTGDVVYTPVYLSVTNRYKVTFVDEDTTTVLKAETEYDYGTPAASIVQPATPTKTGDVQYGYTFVGWTPVLGDVVDHVTYIATYDRFVNKYKVTFLNHDGTVLSQKEYDYGTEGSAIELPADPVKPEDDRFIYTFAGWSPSVQEVTGDVVYTPTYTTELRFPMVDLTITTTCANKDQSFVFTVVGKADDIAYGEVRLEVILVGDDSVTIRDLPVGDYTVTEKDGWSWRHTEKAQQSVRLDEAEELTFAFGGNDKLFWLSGWHANKRRKGGN